MRQRTISTGRRLATLLLFAAGPVLSSCGGPAVQPTEKPLLWRIQGAATPSYVYGTIHLPDPRVTTLPPEVEAAIHECDALLTEISLTPSAMMELSRAMRLERGERLADLLTEPLLTKLEDYVCSKGYPFSRLARMRAWAAMMTIGAIDAVQGSNREVLDQVLVRRGRDAGKQLDALETVTEQIAVFESFSTEEQVSMLAATLDLLVSLQAKNQSPTAELLEAYLTGDENQLLKLATKYNAPGIDPDLQDRFVQAVLTDRNKRMATRIAARIKEHPDQVNFFAVGAAHCPGETGVLQLLEELGYPAQRVRHEAEVSAPADGPAAPR